MATPLWKFGTQSVNTHNLKQFLFFYEFKEFEFLPGLLGP